MEIIYLRLSNFKTPSTSSAFFLQINFRLNPKSPKRYVHSDVHVLFNGNEQKVCILFNGNGKIYLTKPKIS